MKVERKEKCKQSYTNGWAIAWVNESHEDDSSRESHCARIEYASGFVNEAHEVSRVAPVH